jgi:hypothetical protein
MSKQSKNSPIIAANFTDSWADNAVLEWISSNRKALLWGVAALFAGLILSYRLLFISTLNFESDFFRAQTLFTQFQEKTSEDTADLNELEAIMRRHPELQAKFDGALAQTLIIDGDIPKAQVFADLTFQRTRPDHLALYEDFAKTSLVIGAGQYDDALQQANQLKGKMEAYETDVVNSTLYAYNLVRIAVLNQQLGQQEAELQAWAAVQSLSNDSKAAISTNELFKTGSASLNQYIIERKKTL